MQETRNRETGFRWWLCATILSVFYALFRCAVVQVNEDRALKLCRWFIHLIHDPLKSKRLANYRRFYGAPDLSRDEKLDAGYLDYMARFTAECIHAEKMSLETIRRQGELHGRENLENALKLGRGVILLGGHIGNYYASHGVLAVEGYKVTTISERLPIASAERQINRLRKKFHVSSTFVDESAARTAIRTFRENGIFSILFEVTIRRDRAVTLPFGHGTLNLDLGPAFLALRYRVPVLPVSVRSDRPYHHRVEIHPPLPEPSGSDDPDKALRYLECWRDWLFGEVEANPEQWWPWFLEDFLAEPKKGKADPEKVSA